MSDLVYMHILHVSLYFSALSDKQQFAVLTKWIPNLKNPKTPVKQPPRKSKRKLAQPTQVIKKKGNPDLFVCDPV